MTTLQFTRFRLPPGREQTVLRARRESLGTCWTANPPLRAAYLVRLPEGDWLDITVWADQEHEAPTEPRDTTIRMPTRSEFFGHLDELVGEESGTIESEDLPPGGYCARNGQG
jgi:hypothetical protein